MALIRVDPTKLRSSATVMGSIAGDAIELADRAISATAAAPSYEGQFGPAVHAIGAEAAGRMRSLSLLLEERNEYLGRKAEAFEAADQAVVSTIGGIPFYTVPPWITFQIEIPQWLKDAIAFIISMFPGGDLLDILPQLWNMLSGQEVDDLVLSLAVIGLLMDLGYIDPIPAEEVGNAGAALLKLIAKKIPKGPARDAIAKAFKAIIENTDKLPKFVDVFTKLVGRSNVLTALAEKHPELFARLLNGSPEALEQILKHSDDAIVKYLDEIAGKGLGRVSMEQGLELSDLARRYGVDIHMAGKLADSEAEAAFRRILAEEATELSQKDGISFLEAQLRVAEKYKIDFFQVKFSSPGDIIKDADAFIDADQWAKLSKTQQDEIRQSIADVLGLDVKDVDFYQELSALDPVKSGIPPGKYTIPDPAHNVPPGAVRFGADGSVDHLPMSNPEYFKQILGGLGIELP